MTKRSRSSCALLAHVVLISLFAVNYASAKCSQFKPLFDLTTQMRQVAIGQVPFGDATAQRVTRKVQAVNLDEVRRRLIDLSMSAQFRHAQEMVDIATEYSRTMRTKDPVALNRSVYNLETLFERICSSRLEDDAINHESGLSGKVYQALLLKGDDSTLKIILVLFDLAAIIGLLVLSKYFVGYVIGLLHQKKICRIPAHLHGNNQIFPGIVTRAGLNGVRFEFESDAVAKCLTDLMATPEFVYFDLWIDNKNWPVFVDGYHKFFAPLYFLTKIKRGELNTILLLSTRATQHAPAIGHKSNRRKWRSEIKQRKANIRNASLRRADSG